MLKNDFVYDDNNYLKDKNIFVTDDISDGDDIFFNSDCCEDRFLFSPNNILTKRFLL